MQAFIATIRTATQELTELLVSLNEADALVDAEQRHSADGQTVMISVEQAQFDAVIVVGAPTASRSAEADALEKLTTEHAARFHSVSKAAGIHRVQVPFSAFGRLDPVLQDVELLASYDDGYSRVRKQNGTTCKVHTSTIRPLSAAVLATLNGLRRQLVATRNELAA
jgi:hypothetical protein